ncbi:hypothetical protein BAUCODRAFT_248193 [Baudoinia panamericana UAMH 10762]|uniref:Uncharacterized protein n=1 Tax=Baudoinia panamericana (strain UAMH 10762) TaxID=717646 RepID=M2LHL1_BAUPA|nr:uncharacterized protein BAUCODRAFT_248193 [Baudoinia panamericana UAMH 10762]EMC93647.1 hypothetical protein BAUCODRAFT_248193 [Baudoinia panamericana UAMH 10762]
MGDYATADRGGPCRLVSPRYPATRSTRAIKVDARSGVRASDALSSAHHHRLDWIKSTCDRHVEVEGSTSGGCGPHRVV